MDACAAAGGGTVEVPAGVYLSGTLWLRSHTHLHLSPRATLKASPRREDYNSDDAFPQNRVSVLEKTSGAHFLLAIQVSDVAITGEGTIDGNEAVFRGPLIGDLPEPVFGPSQWRPGQMVYFCEASDIVLRGVNLKNAPYWHLFLHGCRNIRIDALTINIDRRTRNGDGIGLDCCRNAAVSNSLIDTSDDCITVRASGHALTQTQAVSENITVTNCVLRSRTCGVRIGVGDGTIRNVVFSNITARDVQSGIHFNGKYTPASPGVEIENVRFNQFSISGKVAFHLTAGLEATKAIRDIFFSNINAVCDSTSYLGGAPGHRITGIHFDNIHLKMKGGSNNTPDSPTPYTRYGKAKTFSARALGMPHAFVMEHAERIDFHNMTVEWGTTDGPWVNTFHCIECSDLSFRDVRVEATTAQPGGAVFLLRQTEGVTFRNCVATRGTAVFAELIDSPMEQIRCSGNDLSLAACDFVTSEA